MQNVPSAFTDDFPLPGSLAQPASRSRQALEFFVISLLVIGFAAGLAWLLMRFLGRTVPDHLAFPAAFVFSTPLLIVGSVAMQRALSAVRREQRLLFLRRLVISLIAAALFMGVQSYALWTIIPADRSPESASVGVAPFVLMLAALHGFHFLVASLFVSFVTARALAGRYDHEYHWGVTVCAWFWHGLGVVWLAILAVYTIVTA